MTTEPNKPLSEQELEILFEQARQVNADPSMDLLQRILSDADAEMPRKPADIRSVSGNVQTGFIARMLSQIGGLAGAAGLAVAGVSGLLIGYSDLGLQDIAAQAIGLEIIDYDLSDLYPGFGAAQEDI